MTANAPDTDPAALLAAADPAGPQRPALIAGGAELGYPELRSAVSERALELRNAGVRSGDVAVLEVGPGLDFGVALHALDAIGATALPLNPRLPDAERAAAIAQADPAAVVRGGNVEAREASSVAAESRRADHVGGEDATVARILTSGTSGAGKQIALSRANFTASAHGTAEALGAEAGGHWLCCLPLFHVGGLSILTRAAINGTTAEIHDGFEVERVANSLQGGAVTGISLVATQLKRLLEAGADISGPEAVVLGGGPLPRDLLEEALGRGVSVLQTYGLTEACSQVTILRPGEALKHLGSSGTPIPGTSLRIADGEILVKGPIVSASSIGSDGWLHTGDVGHLDDGGYLYVTDRLGDMIVSGGENVLPGEVEEALRSHPAVDDVAVVGREDPEWGEAVTAVIVLADGASADAEELRAHCAARLAPHQVPKRYEFTETLPRTASGKLRRRELR